MRHAMGFVGAGVALVGLAFLGGCASGGSGDGQYETRVVSAMYCPKCETVWVPTAQSYGTKVTALRSEKRMTCPTCDQTAQHTLAGDGKVALHDCPECQAVPVLVKPIKPLGPKGTHANQ